MKLHYGCGGRQVVCIAGSCLIGPGLNSWHLFSPIPVVCQRTQKKNVAKKYPWLWPPKYAWPCGEKGKGRTRFALLRWFT